MSNIAPDPKAEPVPMSPVESGRKGGLRRAAALSPQRKTEIARMGAAAIHKDRPVRATNAGAIVLGVFLLVVGRK